MNWLRNLINSWLGVNARHAVLLEMANEVQGQIDNLTRELRAEQEWRFKFVSSLREKTQTVKRYTDYESSQVAVLEEFKEG